MTRVRGKRIQNSKEHSSEESVNDYHPKFFDICKKIRKKMIALSLSALIFPSSSEHRISPNRTTTTKRRQKVTVVRTETVGKIDCIGSSNSPVLCLAECVYFRLSLGARPSSEDDHKVRGRGQLRRFARPALESIHSRSCHTILAIFLLILGDTYLLAE